MRKNFFTDKTCATLLGLAIGDALGAPVEGFKPGRIKTLVKTLSSYIDLKEYRNKGIRSYRMKGLYTDDTQQMLAVCDTILAHNGLTADKLSDTFIRMCEEDVPGGFGVFRSTGRFFRMTMSDYLNDVPWQQAQGNSAGCMAAVRVAPVCVFYFDTPAKIMRKTIESSIVTHKDPIGISAALWQAYLIFQLLKLVPDTNPDIAFIFENCAEFCREGELMLESHYSDILSLSHPDGLHAVSDFIRPFGQILLSGDATKVNQYIFDYATNFSSKPISKLTVPYSLTLVPLAVSLFFRNLGSFAEPVIKAINAGGDTDTLAALTGSICGAYWGMNAIPENWLQGLVNMKQIKMRAQALVNGKKGYMINDLVEMEKKLTQHEVQLRRKFESCLPVPKQKKKPAKKQSAVPFSDPVSILIPAKEKKQKRRQFEKAKTKEKRERRKRKIIY